MKKSILLFTLLLSVSYSALCQQVNDSIISQVYISPDPSQNSLQHITIGKNGQIYAFGRLAEFDLGENIYQIDPFTNEVTLFLKASDFKLPTLLHRLVISEIYISKNGDLYVGDLYRNGVFRFDGKDWLHIPFPNLPDGSTADGSVVDFYESRNGLMHFVTERGIFEIQNGVAKFKIIPGVFDEYERYKSYEPIQMVDDIKNNSSYVLKGRFIYQITNGNSKLLTHDSLIYDYQSIRNIYPSKKGGIWMATKSGLVYYDGNGNFKKYKTPFEVGGQRNVFESSNQTLIVPGSSFNRLYNGEWEELTYNGNIPGNPYQYAEHNNFIYYATGRVIFKINDQPINKTGCLSGIVYSDKNKNGVQDFNDYGLFNKKVKLLPNNRTTYTDFEGRFSFDVEPGVYSIEHSINDKKRFFPTSQVNIPHIVVGSQCIDTLNIGISNIKNETLLNTNFHTTRTRCGFTVPAYINYANIGTNNENVKIKLNLKDGVKFDFSQPSPDSVSTDSTFVSWKRFNFFPNQFKQIQLKLQMPGVDNIGDTLKFYTTIENDSSFSYTDTIFSELRCAYDPNDKNVWPKALDSNYVLMNEKLDYLIRFQNTGNDTAFNIVVRDTISNLLDMNSFEIEATSHPMRVEFDSIGNVAFNFNSILLPDSNVNEVESHGFIKYTIKPKSNLPEHTVVNNTAHIYFDFNPAIVTNTIFSTYVTEIPYPKDSVTGFRESKIVYNNGVTLTPNPFSNQTTLTFNNDSRDNFSFVVYDVTGKLVFKQKNIIGNSFEFNRGNLVSGMYFYNLINTKNNTISTGKLIVQ